MIGARFTAARPTFGRGPARTAIAAIPSSSPGLSDDLRLFGTTFVAGFLFVSLLIG